MTRQDLIDNCILKSNREDSDLEYEIKQKLEIRDKFRTYPEEEADIEEFAKNTKNFLITKLVTPFGDFPVFIDRSCHKEVLEYMREDYLGAYKGLKLKES